MKNKNSISLTLFLSMSGVFALMIGIIAYDIKEIGIKGVREKAEAVANVVQIGLTSHMVQGTMEHREAFISQVENLEGVEKIWIVRGESVREQYGEGMKNERPRDSMDSHVLESGTMQILYDDSLFADTTYRVSIPYRAEATGAINCLNCHNAKVGDTLGSISIEINMNTMKIYGLQTVGYTAVIALAFIAFILTFVNRLIGPYIKIFDSIKRVMKRAEHGDYSGRITEIPSGEAKEVAEWINTLLVKLQTTLEQIEEKIRVFLAQQKNEEKDPLIGVKTTVTRLSDIYRFRKAIEHDEKIDEVYERFAKILRDKFGLRNFNFLEADTTNKKVEVVYTEQEIACDAITGCRADRTNTPVDSCQFDRLCKKMPENEETEYLCIPYSISNDLDLVVSIVTHDKEETQRVRGLMPSIQDYVDAAKPEIVSKKLTQLLEKSARTDALTGLFNRQYLEESIEKIVNQSKRTAIPYGVLMVDIDHFKMINDTYGHDVGDEAIRTISGTLEENVRESDLVVRFGGEEFIVLLYNCNAEYVVSVAEKIREAFAKKKIRGGAGVSFTKTISIGAAVFPDQSDSFWKVIKYADVALYHAKNNGRNRVELYSDSMIAEGELDTEY